MVGGGEGAFIGAVHRHVLALDQRYELVAGALSSTPERARASGLALGLAPQRAYPSLDAMLVGERALPAEVRAEVVVIVTPNHLHAAQALALVQAGFHVVCDKPMVVRTSDAEALVRAVDAAGVVFAVTYNYTGYPMVQEARALVQSGALGKLRSVEVGYHQGWLATALERQADEAGSKQAQWRTQAALAGAGALGDIGSHAENLISTVTGLTLEALCADVTSFVPNREVDDHASILLRFAGGARGSIRASQVAIGHENDLTLAVYGDAGSLCWRQQEPETLTFTPLGASTRLLRRGDASLSERARSFSRLPGGHPEGFIEAFANIYRAVADAVLQHARDAAVAKRGGYADAGFPTVRDGARGVRFIERALVSARSNEKWTVF